MKKLIYLEDAIDAIKDADVLVSYDTGTDTDDACELAIHAAKGSVIESLKALPEAEPERKAGRWIRHPEQNNIYGGKCVECSECGEKYVVSHIEDEKYCRNCGAKMEVQECD